MPATPCPRIVAFVEGTMEKMFFNTNLRDVSVVPISNGAGWTLKAMCGQIGSKFSAKDPHADLLVVWLDKEKQACTVEEYRDAIRNELVCRGADPGAIRICLPDRMTENIMLADEEMIQEVFGKPDYKYDYEGKNGKSVIKEFYRELGKNYQETYHGVELMKKLRLRRAAKTSGSVSVFVGKLEMDCWWLGPA